MKRNWRESLSAEEKAALKALETRIKELAEEIGLLRFQRLRIQNRATVRAGK